MTLTLDQDILHTVMHHSRPLPTYQISLKLKKFFVDVRTYGWADRHLRPTNVIRSTRRSWPNNNNNIRQCRRTVSHYIQLNNHQCLMTVVWCWCVWLIELSSERILTGVKLHRMSTVASTLHSIGPLTLTHVSITATPAGHDTCRSRLVSLRHDTCRSRQAPPGHV